MSKRSATSAKLLGDGKHLCDVHQIEFSKISDRFASLAGSDYRAVSFTVTAAISDALNVQRHLRYDLRFSDGQSLRVQPVSFGETEGVTVVTALILSERARA